MKLYSLISAMITAFFIVACNRTGSDEKNISEIEKDKIVDEFREMNKKANEIYYRFPSPDEMFTFVNNEGLQFDFELLNPVENKDKYIDTKSQTINLGIYIADLGYITLFEKYKESVNYFDVIYELSEQLRVSTAFDKQLMKRIENNLKNVDSLKIISNDSYAYLIDYLVQNDKEKTFAIISMGAYIEFLYITLNLIGEYNPKNITIQRIAEQKYVFENLFFYFEEFRGDPVVDALYKEVVGLKVVIDKITEQKEKTSVSKGKDGKLILGGGSKIVIKSEQFYELKEASSKIRNKFVDTSSI